MSVSKIFKDTIKAELDRRAAADELFAKSYAKENKSLDECCNFILGQVRKMNVQGLSDEEVYSLAVHYYDEDDLGEINAINGRIVVNHVVELSEEEKAKAKLCAMRRIEEEEYVRLQKELGGATKPPKKIHVKSMAPAQSAANTPSLFDFE